MSRPFTILRRLLFSAFLLGGASALWAQTTVPTPAGGNLPLRNLLIEVRQDDGSAGTQEQLGARVQARVQAGDSQASVTLQGQGRQFERSGSARQQVLVLNGRPAAINLGSGRPLRLRHFIVQNGVRRSVPGAVWVQAGTGFTATPIWEGGDTVYLELVATQGRQPLAPQASTSSTVLLPLDEWITIADSDEAQNQQQAFASTGGGGRDSRHSSHSLRVQVRVSAR